MIVKPREIYTEDGDLDRIEFYNQEGKFEIQAVWDDQDPNDEEHRIKFREWAYRIVGQVDDGKYEVEP